MDREPSITLHACTNVPLGSVSPPPVFWRLFPISFPYIFNASPCSCVPITPFVFACCLCAHTHTHLTHTLCLQALIQNQILKPILNSEVVYIKEGHSCSFYPFWNIFSNICNAPLLDLLGILINVGPRIKRGCF